METALRAPDLTDQMSGAPARGLRVRRPALLGSLLVHAGVLLLLLHRITAEDESRIKFVPVELVPLVEKAKTPAPARPEAPRQQNASLRPQTRKAPAPSIPLTPPRAVPSAPEQGSEPVPQPPKDELQSRLEAFAKLSIPGNGAFSVERNGICDRSTRLQRERFCAFAGRAPLERRS